MLKRFLFGIVLLGLLTLTAAWSADTPYKLYSFYSITESYTFSLTQWEAQNLFGKCLYHAREHHQRHELSREQEIEIVEEYFGLGHAEAVLESEMRQSKDAPGDGDSKTRRLMEKQLESVRERRHALEGKTEEIISKQISQILTQQGLASKHWRAFPPVEFKMDELPHLLIISPRDKIELMETVLLQENLSLGEITEIEDEAEELGVSALIERVGGIATYPSMVPLTASLDDILPTIVHEWMHQYLFFHPLGRHYWASYEMRTINETVADMAGEELGSIVLQEYYDKETKKRNGETPETAFDFNKEMREIRLTVDSYLDEGKIEAAESFMREKRDFLQSKGYHIRKLNQAYFAWHGTYADSPTSVSPIGKGLRELRSCYPSPGEFIKAVSQISSYEEFEEMLQDTAESPG